MSSNGIPVIQGSLDSLKSVEQAVTEAEKIGFPILLKASGGGGGIGMEVVSSREKMEKSLGKCQGRAKSSFGDDTVYIEKYLHSPRHIEIQIVADSHGNIWHLDERDCSVQRRHQKVIEESPSPAVTETTRTKMGEVAVQAGSAIGYDSVGTVEMLMDNDGTFYFLEMNTRIQVEHGVTELRTGVDLIELQLRAAAGERLLPIENKPYGHSIQCRVYAENPSTFFPSCGVIEKLAFPDGDGIRIDHSIEEGSEITPFYDPLLAKILVIDSDRGKSIEKMKDVLSRTVISGISTNIPFLLKVLENREFAKNGATTLLSTEIISDLKSQAKLAKKS
jgi:acetyl-CoA carboxylase biotin carboxylase subunit